MKRLRRRRLLIAAGMLLATPFAGAQSARVRRVAYITTTSPLAELLGSEPAHRPFRAFLQELKARGWIEGKNLVLDRRSAEGRFESAPALVTASVQGGAEVLVVNSSSFARAAMKAAPTTPIVMIGSSPVEEGIVRNLGRPGGNVTGATTDAGPEYHAKRLELLRDTLPRAKVVALLTTEAGTGAMQQRAAMHEAARTIGLDLFDAAWSNNTFEAAFKVIEARRPGAMLVQQMAPHWARREEIVKFARSLRLPDFHAYADSVESGALCSYGVDITEPHRVLADYVDRILKGARPGELPFMQPSKFEFAINLRTANALGLKISPAILQRTDRVVE